MKPIYDLAIALEHDPRRVTDTQALTRDTSRPLMGLKGEYGLLRSAEWWSNLKSGKIPLKSYEGEIVSLQFEGMNSEGRSFTLRLDGGGQFTYSRMANKKDDLQMYEVGRYLRLTFFEEIKKTGEVLEMLWKLEIASSLKSY